MKAAPLYKKITAALLLLVMLLTTFVQVTHSHNSKAAVAAPAKKAAAINTPCVAASADVTCFLCDYQLAKDADFSVAVNSVTTVQYKSSYAVAFKNSLITNFTPAAGNRGPPSLV